MQTFLQGMFNGFVTIAIIASVIWFVLFIRLTVSETDAAMQTCLKKHSQTTCQHILR